MKTKKKTILICVAGGTGSGKTTICKEIKKVLPKSVKSQLLCLDSFYLQSLSKERQNKSHTNINFDHPNSFDWNLLYNTISKIINGSSAIIPVYDYKKSSSVNGKKRIFPCDVIILEGILSLYDKKINSLADVKIFIDTPDDERFIRRLLRDCNERGRSLDNVIKQWRHVVKPMHKMFISPQKQNADIIIPWYSMNDVAIKAIKAAINDLVKDK